MPPPSVIWETDIPSLSEQPREVSSGFLPWQKDLSSVFLGRSWGRVSCSSDTLVIWRRAAECHAGQPELTCTLLEELSRPPTSSIAGPGAVLESQRAPGREAAGQQEPLVCFWGGGVIGPWRAQAPRFAGRASEGGGHWTVQSPVVSALAVTGRGCVCRGHASPSSSAGSCHHRRFPVETGPEGQSDGALEKQLECGQAWVLPSCQP